MLPAHIEAARAAVGALTDWLAGRAGAGPYKAASASEIDAFYVPQFNGYLIPEDAQAEIMARARKATSGGEDYDVIRADLVNRLTDAFQSFVSTNGRSARNDAKRALVEDIPAAFERGYQDAGGEELEDDDNAWVTAKQAEQLAFMGDALASLRDLGDSITEDTINARAELWGGMLDGVYSEGKLRGSKNMMCYFDGDDGAESCDTCQKLKDGPNRSVKWILAHNMIPHPGNKEFDCGGWRCEHGWRSAKTDEWMTL